MYMCAPKRNAVCATRPSCLLDEAEALSSFQAVAVMHVCQCLALSLCMNCISLYILHAQGVPRQNPNAAKQPSILYLCELHSEQQEQSRLNPFSVYSALLYFLQAVVLADLVLAPKYCGVLHHKQSMQVSEGGHHGLFAQFLAQQTHRRHSSITMVTSVLIQQT